MQGQRSSTGALPENLFFGNGSVSDDPLVDTQVTWNNSSGTYEQSRPSYTLPSNPNSVQFLQHSGLYDQNVEWNSGESSSNASQLQVNLNEREPEGSWNVGSGGVLTQSTVSSLENRCVSRKRKALELNMGQSSGEGSSNYFESHDERSQGQAWVASSTSNMPLQTENNVFIGNTNVSEPPATSRHRLVIREAVSSNPFSSTASGSAESSRRNLRLRVNSSTHQSPRLGNSAYSSGGNVESSSSNDPLRMIHNHLLDLNPTPAVEDTNLRMHPVSSHLPNVHRNTPSRWSLAPRTRFGSSSSSEIRDPSVSSMNIPEHPMLLSSTEIENSSENPTFFNLTNGNTSTAQTHSNTGLNSSEIDWSNRTTVLRPRRQTETVRRPILSSSGVESGARSGPPGLVILGRGARAALLERHMNATDGLSRSLRTTSTATDEGRSSAMRENVWRILDMVRRGEGIRFEDMMLLDLHTVFGMSSIHDRHRDMRMDVDNMSYEELLALEERIGNVCTGLSETTIMKHLKQQTYTNDKARDQGEDEPCSICREEYNEGDYLGKLECGHNFHRDCIKQWLTHKNLCPICRTPGLKI